MENIEELLAMAAVEVKRSLREERDKKVLQRICLKKECGVRVPKGTQYLFGECATCNRRVERYVTRLRAEGRGREANAYLSELIRDGERVRQREVFAIRRNASLNRAAG